MQEALDKLTRSVSDLSKKVDTLQQATAKKTASRAKTPSNKAK